MRTNKPATIILCSLLIACSLTFSGCDGFNLIPTTQSSTAPQPTITSTPLPTITANDLELVYEDTFDDEESGWTTAVTDTVGFTYTDGEYKISVKDDDMLHYSSNNNVTGLGNFVVEVEAGVPLAVDGFEYGILFRCNDNREYYQFMINGGKYKLKKRLQGNWITIQNYTESGSISTDGGKNSLKVACLGTTIELYVNGQRLTTVEDDSLSSGKITLAASGINTNAYFDDFRVYRFTNEYITAADPDIPVINTASFPNGQVDVFYSEKLSASGGGASYRWTLTDGALPDGLTLDDTTGEIYGTPAMDGNYTFSVTLSSDAGEATGKYTIQISQLMIATESLANGIYEISYNQTLEASGGEPPYTWAIVSGDCLPQGLTLDASGVISGVPEQYGGPFTPLFQVIDSAGAKTTAGISLTVQIGDFQAIDEYADAAPTSVRVTIQTLVQYLVAPCDTDTEKARGIYRWITQNIDYDVYTFVHKEAPRPDQSAEAVFSRGNGVCEGYAKLFRKMAEYAGLPAEYVTGWSRTELTKTEFKSDHAWNAVQIDGKWHLVDVTWGAGYTEDDERFVRSFDDFWFLTPPEQFVYSHSPEDSSWQLLTPAVSESRIAKYPLVTANYFRYGLDYGKWDETSYNVPDGSGMITIEAPPDVLIAASLYRNGAVLAERMVFRQRLNNTYEISVRLPYSGDYELRISAKWKTDTGAYSSAISYKLTLTGSTTSLGEFPETFAAFSNNGGYLYTPLTGDLPAGTSQYFKILVPSARKVAVISGGDGSSSSREYLSKDGQLFQGTVTIGRGGVIIVAWFDDGTTYHYLIEYDS